MKEYLKMKDVFVVDGDADFAVLLPMSVRPEFDDCVTPHDYAAHAINSHDELVADAERLNDEMQDILEMVDAAVRCGDFSIVAKIRGKYISD